MIKDWRGGEKLDAADVCWLTAPKHGQVGLTYIAVSVQRATTHPDRYCQYGN